MRYIGYFKKENIIILIGLIILFNDFFPIKDTNNYDIKLISKSKHIEDLNYKIEQRDSTIKILEDEFHKIENDPTIDTATTNELRSFFTDYLNR